MDIDREIFRGFRRTGIGATVSVAFLTLQACTNCSGVPPKADVAPASFWSTVESAHSLPPTPQAIRSQLVAFDVEQLRPPLNNRIVLSLPDGREIAALVMDYEVIGNDQFVWRGEIEGEVDGMVTLSVINGKLVGDIITENGNMYSIRSVAPGIALVEELDPTQFPEEAEPSQVEKPPTPERPSDVGIDGDTPVAPPDDPVIIGLMQRIGLVQRAEAQPAPDKTLIDVMVLYTDGVLEFAGDDEEAVHGKIAQAISDANRSYRSSQVNQQLRLAHFEHTTYQETDDLHQALSALKDSSNIEALSGVIETRSDYNADIVVMLTKPVPRNGMCGHASQMTENSPSFCDKAFAVVPVNCATSKHSFAHELGHVMGANHNIMFDSDGTPIKIVNTFEHSHGFVSPTNRWRTIMSYPTASCVLPRCKRIPYWSNPSVSYPPPNAANQVQPQTVFTGSDVENNTLSLNSTRGNVASFSDACN